jgi:hypothetical protein
MFELHFLKFIDQLLIEVFVKLCLLERQKIEFLLRTPLKVLKQLLVTLHISQNTNNIIINKNAPIGAFYLSFFDYLI